MAGAKDLERMTVVAIQAVFRTEPHKSTLVLQNTQHRALRQAILYRQTLKRNFLLRRYLRIKAREHSGNAHRGYKRKERARYEVHSGGAKNGLREKWVAWRTERTKCSPLLRMGYIRSKD